MTEFKQGDVCSLEVVIDRDGLCGDIVFAHCQPSGATVAVRREDLTLIRRAPVDPATCDLSEPVDVILEDGTRGSLLFRYKGCGFIAVAGDCLTRHVSLLRPADAPAPVAEAGEVERLRAREAKAAEEQGKSKYDHVTLNKAPSCPPGHVLINGQVVPEPMREAPARGYVYWVPRPDLPGMVAVSNWEDTTYGRNILGSGLIHSTKLAARAHAKALIAPTKRDGSHD